MSRRRRAATGLVVAGMVLRSAKEGSFVLRTADETQHELPVEAVEDFKVLGGGAGVRLTQLSLNAERLGAELAAALGPAQAARRPEVARSRKPRRSTNSRRETNFRPSTNFRRWTNSRRSTR